MDKESYKLFKKEAEKVVAIAKSDAYDQWYEELDTKEGQGKIFRIAKQRHKRNKDITHIRKMEDNDGLVLRRESDIIKRWKEYYEKLMKKVIDICEDWETPTTKLGETSQEMKWCWASRR